jgi:hypothetical protein
MNKNRVALLWATLILAVAFAAGAGVVDEQLASVSYLLIVLVAVIHIGRAPCAVDLRRKDS